MKRKSDNIRRVGLLGNAGKEACRGAVQQAAALVRAANRSIYSDTATSELAGLEDAIVCADAAALVRQVDLLMVFGGDGTILRVAREVAGSRTPLLGVNIGSLGFLTAVPSNEMEQAFEHVWNGDFDYELRTLIHACGPCADNRVDISALNDIVISRGTSSRLIELDVRVNGDLLTRYRCDGLIFCSATGSTAYSLAAGGAVVFPTARVICLTPICPHTLSNRALILPLTAVIEVSIVGVDTILSADGQTVRELHPGDTVQIRRSRWSVRLVHLAGSTFCETLRRKLHWRGATL